MTTATPALPKEITDFMDRNARYAEVLLQQQIPDPKKMQAIRSKLKLAPTPKEVMYRENTLQLYRYRPRAPRRGLPVLVVPSLILKYYIMDLMSGHSLIEHLLDQGLDVWLVDWGTPGDEHGQLTLGDYIDTFLRRCARQVSRQTGHRRINMLGQCLGGTMATAFASLYPDQLERLALLTTPVDFEDSGLLSLWTKREHMNIAQIVNSFGPCVPAGFIHTCFQFLDVKSTVERYKKLYNNVLDDGFMRNYLALDHWLQDKIPFPAPAFRDLIQGLYQENRFIQGTFEVRGRVADPAQIKCPVLSIGAKHDHVFPEKAAKALGQKVRNFEYVSVPTGHVTCIVLFPTRQDTYKRMSDFLLT